MKWIVRGIACLLALLVLMLSMSSCISMVRLADLSAPSKQSLATQPIENGSQKTTEPQDSTDPDSTPVEWQNFLLSDADLESFKALISSCMDLMEGNAEPSKIEAELEKLDDLYSHIATQSQIAYILYCKDLRDESASEDYLYASEMQADAYNQYMLMCQAVDRSSFAYRESFFADWNELQLENMRQYNEELSELSKQNDALLVEYRDLDPNSKNFEAEVCSLYKQVAQTNHQLARENGFSDYFSYAYHHRDYTKQDLEVMRSYVQTYLVPLCKDAYDVFYESYQDLSYFKKKKVSSVLYSDYSSLDPNLVQSYFSSLPDAMQKGMSEVLEPSRALYVDSQHAYEGAFTGYLHEYKYPICYFGPGYQSSFTVVHEAGHYYAALGLENVSNIDLAEVHSQGNEWLFLTHIESLLQEDVYQTLCAYQLYQNLAMIILCVVVDEFEQTVYQNVATLDGSAAQMDAYMTEICLRYGGEEFIDTYITDVSLYWKRVVIESPVYYISYAVSGIAALTLYGTAREDYNAALETYRKLVEEIEDDGLFLAHLQNAGLASPFEKSAYTKISELLN